MQIDAALAAKLALVLKKVAHGKTLAVAAAEAGVGAADVERVVKEAERALWERARSQSAVRTPDPSPAKKAARKPARRSKARGGLALIAYADGGSRGNPGRAACGVLITDADGAELLRRGKRIGKTTNNVAEYEGVLMALDLCRELGAQDVTLRLDSELVVRQLEGRYKVRHPGLAKLHARAADAIASLASFRVEHVPRAQNQIADAITNAALDGKELD